MGWDAAWALGNAILDRTGSEQSACLALADRGHPCLNRKQQKLLRLWPPLSKTKNVAI